VNVNTPEAKKLHPLGIRVVSIEPAFFRTNSDIKRVRPEINHRYLAGKDVVISDPLNQ
jgi:hypothetical protein